jgi:hypothetical protein
MAYNNKYKITVATKSGTISYLYLLEDGYVGSLIEYPAINLELQYIPKSDDVFEAIMASQLNISIDITDYPALMPNFTTLNDRKYLVKLYNNDTLEWQGWAISDSVNVSYTTGRQELSFNAIDGLGILEKINYPISTTTTLVDLKKCIEYILTSLNLIGFPTGLNVISGISYFAEGMTNRTINTASDPLNQSYLRITTFLDDNSQSFSCLQVLNEILKGFGARLFQTEGKWYIITPNQFAQSSYYFTEYNSSGTVVTSGTKSLLGNIEGYTGNTSGLYYVDNSQTKILRKGYNKISYEKEIDYPNNYITNANLQQYTGVDPFAWTLNATSGAYSKLKVYEFTDFNSIILYSGNVGTANAYPNFLPSVKFNDVIKLSFDISNIIPYSSANIIVKVSIAINDGTNVYYLNSNSSWVSTSATYDVEYTGGNFPTPPPAISQTINIDMPPAPQDGVLSIIFLNDTNCIDWCEISNFKLDTTQLFQSILIDSYTNDVEEYVYTPDINIGMNYTVVGKYFYRGALSDINGNNFINWYRQEYPSTIKNSLIELVIQQYSNILQNNIINIDSTFFGLQNDAGRLSAGMRITSNDTDIINSVQNKKYMLGNSTINFYSSEVQSTLLEINNENVSTTMNVVYVDTNPQRVFGRLRSNGETTSSGANAAPLTSNKIYQSGAYFYIDRNLASVFNGGSLYYKVQDENLITFRIFRINNVGRIIGFEPR